MLSRVVQPARLCIVVTAMACTALLGTVVVNADTGDERVAASAPLLLPGEHDNGLVTADRCNVRSRPSTTAEIVVQLNKNATVRILGEKNVSEHGRTRNWFNIQLPPDAKCYIASQYVVDGVVNADSLYVRCGAGKNYRDIGKLSNGDAVEVIAHEGDWSRIRATEGCTGWIAAELVEVAPPAAPEPKPAAAAEPEVVIEATSAFVADPAEAAATERVQVISTDPDVHVAYVWKKGILSRHSTGSSDPAEYQLMRETDMGRRHRVCFVIPPKDLAIKRFEDKMVRIAGNLRWFKGDRYPILEADKIDIVW